MKKTVIYNQLFTYLLSLYPNPETELNYETPFQLLVAVMLSAQATDKSVNKVTDKLFQTIKSPQDIITFGQSKLEQSIRSINYFRNKAKYIYKTSELLLKPPFGLVSTRRTKGGRGDFGAPQKTTLTPKEKIMFKQYGYYIPEEISELTKLPWIGIKTANVVAQVLYNKRVVAVDTHVHRVLNRLGLVTTKTPEATHKIIEKELPSKYKTIANHILVLFGRYHCKAIKPRCGECALKEVCEFGREKR